MTERYDKPEPLCWCEYLPHSEELLELARGCPTHGPRGDEDYAVNPDARKILLAGDTHGDANAVKTLLEKARDIEADALFVLGDFGIWDHHDGGAFTDHVSRFTQRYGGIPVCFLPGNHDNYDLLFKWEAENSRTRDGFVFVKEGLFYSPRGHRFTWGGVRFLSLGGAYSVDKEWRVIQDGIDLAQVRSMKERGMSLNAKEKHLLKTGQHRWWSQEEISEQEMWDAAKGGDVDVMLAHDKPRDAVVDWNRKDLVECWPNQDRIQSVIDHTHPKLYVHGHLHYAYETTLPKTETFVKGLDCDPTASRSSGGSGKSHQSWAVLRIQDDRYTLDWRGKDGSKQQHRDFVLQES